MGIRQDYLARLAVFGRQVGYTDEKLSSKVWGYRDVTARVRAGNNFTIRRLEEAESYMAVRGFPVRVGIRQEFLNFLDTFMLEQNMGVSDFGLRAWGNAKQLWRIRHGGNFTLHTVEGVEDYVRSVEMHPQPAAPAAALAA